MARKLTISIETMANLLGVDQLIEKLEVLQTHLTGLKVGVVAAEMKDLAASTKTAATAMGTLGTKTKTAATNMELLYQQTTYVNVSLRNSSTVMNEAGSAAAFMAAGMKAAADAQRAWNQAAKSQKVSYGGQNVGNAAAAQGKAQGPVPAAVLIPDFKALTAGYAALGTGMTSAVTHYTTLINASHQLNAGFKELGGGIDYIDAEWRFVETQAKSLTAGVKALGTGMTVTASTFSSSGTKMSGTFTKLWSTIKGGASSATNILKTIWNSNPVKNYINILKQLAQIIGQVLKAAFSAAGNAAKTFLSSASSVFSGLQRAINSTRGAFQTFTTTISNGFATAQRHMRDFYNSGWSLLTSGRAIQNVGQNLFGGLSSLLSGYVEFEQSAVKTATSAGLGIADGVQTIQKIVFDIQQGKYTAGNPLGFSATDVSQGLYYYTSAIGVDLSKQTDAQIAGLAPVVANIMQLAQVTQTSLETATKGVLNAVMEFGIDPRDVQGTADILKKVVAQFGYLANLTTMEVPDIAQAFKMVGPLAHAMIGGGPGGGLNETMALLASASDVGLKGGNVGRGVAQVFQKILSPTDKGIETGAEAFGIEASKDAWNAFFLNSDETLKGGLPGLFEKLDKLTKEQIVDIFTTNGSRVIIGIQEAAKASGKSISDYVKDLSGEDATQFLSKAMARNSQSIALNLQNIKNAWFAMQTQMVTGAKSTLLPVLRLFANALWKMSTILGDNPWIGKFVLGLMGIVAAVTTVAGTVLMAAGSVLLLMKGFALLGGVAHPILIFMQIFGSLFLTIVPLMLAATAVVLFFRKAWEENLLGVQQRVMALKDQLTIFFGFLGSSGKGIGLDVFKAYENASYAAGLAIIDWVQKNRSAFAEAGKIARAFAAGFVSSFTDTAAVLAAVGAALVSFVGKYLPALQGMAQNILQNFLGIQNGAKGLAGVIGGILGGSFAVLIFQHFIPSILYTALFRAGLIALRLTMFALSVAAGIVSGAFTVMGIIITGAQAIMGAFSAAFVAVKLAVTTATAASTAANVAEAASIFASDMAAQFGAASQIALGAAQMAETATATAATAAQSALAAAIGAVVAVIALIVISWFSLGIILASTIVLIIALKTAHEGLAAGIQTAIAAAEGIAQGFMMIVGPAIAVLTFLGQMVGALLNFIGATDHARLVGELFGVWLGITLVTVAAITIAFATLATLIIASVVVSFILLAAVILALLSPIFLVIAGIYLIGEALGSLIGFDFWSTIGDGFGFIVDSAEWAANKIGKAFGWVKDTIKDAFSTSDKELLTQLQNDLESLTATKDQYGPDALVEGEKVDTVMARVQGQIDEVTARINAPPTDNSYSGSDDAGQPTAPKAKNTFANYWADFQKKLEKFGYDPNDPMGSLQNIFNLPNAEEIMKGIGNIDVGGFGTIDQQRYMEAFQEYSKYQSDIMNEAKSMAKSAGQVWTSLSHDDQDKFISSATQLVKQTYLRQGIKVPLEPVWNDDSEESFGNAYDKAMDTIKTSLASMKLPDMISSVFGGNSSGSVMLGLYDQISKNVGDNAPWMNPTEMLADLAGQGIIGNDVGAGNTQKTLRPYFERIAQETGITINDAMKDIPKYVVPEEYIPIATTALMKGLSTLGTAAYDALDHGFGTDIINKNTGQVATQTGIDWAELTDYAIGQSIAGHSWNLVDYIADSWGISQSDATQYLVDHGIDRNEISDATFADVQWYKDTIGGQVSALTEQQYQWISDQTNGLTDNIVHMTQEAYDAIPDAVKLSATTLGVTFVIDTTIKAGSTTVDPAIQVPSGLTPPAGLTGQPLANWLWTNWYDLAGGFGVNNTGESDSQYGSELQTVLPYTVYGYQIPQTGTPPPPPTPSVTVNDLPLPDPVEIAGKGLADAATYTTAFAAGLTTGGTTTTDGGTTSSVPTITVDNSAFMEGWQAVMNALAAFDVHGPYVANIGANKESYAGIMSPIMISLSGFENHTYSTTISANATAFWAVFLAAKQAAMDFANSTYTAPLPVPNIVGPAPYAKGGIVSQGLQLVGENGPELAALPVGTNISTTGRTMSMLNAALSSANKPRDNTPPTSSAEFRQATAQWGGANGGGGGNTYNIEFSGPMTISKEVDSDKFFNDFNKKIGQANAMVERGMISYPGSRTL